MSTDIQVNKFVGRTTIHDVAALASVSATTVSHMLSGNRPVSEATKEKIQKAIDTLHFRPNEMARGLRSQRTFTVPLIVSNIAYETYPMIARGAGEVLRSNGFTMAIYETNEDEKILSEILKSITDRRVEGALVFLPGLQPDSINSLTHHGTPVVVSGPPSADAQWPVNVYADEAGGIALATSSLLRSQSAGLAYIGGPKLDSNALARRQGFRAAAHVHGSNSDVMVSASAWSVEAGFQAMKSLIDRKASFTAVVCANDLLAIGAIAAAKAEGLDVPTDLRITGYDNIEAASFVTPSLTSVDPFNLEVGRIAAEQLLEQIGASGTIDSGRDIPVQPALIERGSTFVPGAA